MAALLSKGDPYDQELTGDDILHAVGFDGLLPNLPSKDEFDDDFLELSRRCTRNDASTRPSFTHIHQELKMQYRKKLALTEAMLDRDWFEDGLSKDSTNNLEQVHVILS